jgi:hypothetical protein
MSTELCLNGIDATTGGSLDGDQPITAAMLAKVARGEKLTPEDLRDAKIRRSRDVQARAADFGVAEGIDNTSLAQSGWAVVFPANLPEKSLAALKEALQPLLDLRQAQAAANNPNYYREISGPELGYRNAETKNDFLKRFGRGPGPADPEKFPYYTLLVGSPVSIPFNFQYQLDVQYAVGRIYFEKLEDYYRYAVSVVAAETQKLTRGRQAVFFGPAHPEDPATQMSALGLLQPLAQQVKTHYPNWQVDLVEPEKATKANLANYLGGAQTPALLFTASHGLAFPLNDPRQLRQTGALLCQDWPGRQARVPVTENFYFSADDLPAQADVFGLIAFVFACYGGGMPQFDNFARQAFGEQKALAPSPFLAQLPLKLLSHPRGGALGVFAHVDRAWGQSIQWDGLSGDIETFDSTVSALLNGKPAGAAAEYFNERYAEISTGLTEELENTTPEIQDEQKLAGLWTANNDARNYTFIGDPAVRLPVNGPEAAAPGRASLEAQLGQPTVSGAVAEA